MDPLIVVSNRLPIVIKRDEKGKFTYVRETNGGMANAIDALDTSGGLIWIGWPGFPSDDLTESEKSEIYGTLVEQFGFVPIFQTREQIALYYEGYANDTLWPLFHYFPEKATYQHTYWEAYQAVNAMFLQAIEDFAESHSTIWVNDYHLMLLPTLIRQALPEAKIGFFLHTPFPSYELFRQIPQRNELIKGLLGADLLGFHIYDYARHFISSANRLIGAQATNGSIEYDGRIVKVDTFPIGIAYERFIAQLHTKESQKELQALEEHYKNQKIILAIDRLDYSKGILERMRGFEMFLRQHPEYMEKATLYMIEAPSRTEVPAYKQLRNDVELMVSRINGMYGTAQWAPIIYLFQNFGFDKITPLYHRADVALITPLRDGMNLVAKEYIACKENRLGVLILSETIGAADELIDAILVNPNNTQQVADAILEALSMPKPEQRRRLKRMQKRIKEYSVQRWGTDFVADLKKAALAHKGHFRKRISDKETQAMLNKYRKAHSRLLILDYDGTLKKYVGTPGNEGAKPDSELLSLITRLTEQANTKVVITSGRTKDIMEKWFGKFPRLSLVAEHGAWIKDHGEWTKEAGAFDKRPYTRVMKKFAPRTAGAIIDVKDFGVVWHYRRVSPELAYVRNGELRHELKHIAEGSDIGVYDGRKIIEVKPKHLHKGVITREFTDKYPSDFLLAVGDDYTDEQMFSALPPHALSIKIGPGATSAKYQVAHIDKARQILEDLSSVAVKSPKK